MFFVPFHDDVPASRWWIYLVATAVDGAAAPLCLGLGCVPSRNPLWNLRLTTFKWRRRPVPVVRRRRDFSDHCDQGRGEMRGDGRGGKWWNGKASVRMKEGKEMQREGKNVLTTDGSRTISIDQHSPGKSFFSWRGSRMMRKSSFGYGRCCVRIDGTECASYYASYQNSSYPSSSWRMSIYWTETLM